MTLALERARRDSLLRMTLALKRDDMESYLWDNPDQEGLYESTYADRKFTLREIVKLRFLQLKKLISEVSCKLVSVCMENSFNPSYPCYPKDAVRVIPPDACRIRKKLSRYPAGVWHSRDDLSWLLRNSEALTRRVFYES